MNKIYGTSVRQDGLRQVGRRNFTLFYGLYTDERGSTYEYRHTFDHKPSWNEVKAVLVEAINEHTKETILNGFVWRDQRVWLSEENQLNFAAIERSQSIPYPLTLKINEQVDGTPIYHTFENADEYSAFYQAIALFITETVQSGWSEKDSIEMNTYNINDNETIG